MGVVQAGLSVSGQKLCPDGASGEHGLLLREVGHGFREVAADLIGGRNADLVGQAGGHVRLVNDHRDMQMFCGQNHGYRHKAALGEDHVGSELFDNLPRLGVAGQNPEGIGEVLEVKVAAELSRGDSVVGDARIGDEFFLNSVQGTDVMDIEIRLAKRRNKRQIRRYMAGGAAAGKYDLFHIAILS